MPKKTKKEKLMAMQRRSHVSPVVIRDNTDNKPSESANLPSFSFSASTSPSPASAKRNDTATNYTQMKKDLVKTVIITSIILISEFLLTKWLPQ